MVRGRGQVVLEPPSLRRGRSSHPHEGEEHREFMPPPTPGARQTSPEIEHAPFLKPTRISSVRGIRQLQPMPSTSHSHQQQQQQRQTQLESDSEDEVRSFYYLIKV